MTVILCILQLNNNYQEKIPERFAGRTKFASYIEALHVC